ncbi:MAG TPA: hypothetical protein PK280_05785 [Planctomycetota bacterium]|nr:hypothetical protein [Planctomycetota bacterium]
MTKEEIKTTVVQVIRGYCDAGKRPAISAHSRPVVDLGLESRDGVDFACDISARLGVLVPYEVNPFVSDDGKRARTVGEIVNLLCGYAQQRGELVHA